MRLIPFDHMDEIRLRLSDRRDELAKASEVRLPSDARRQSFIPGDDPAELTPVLRGHAAVASVEQSAAWSRWDWIRWGLPWLGLGLGLGALIEIVIRMRA